MVAALELPPPKPLPMGIRFLISISTPGAFLSLACNNRAALMARLSASGIMAAVIGLNNERQVQLICGSFRGVKLNSSP